MPIIVKHKPDYHSYLVRLWREESVGDEGEPPIWQGELVHIQSGEKWLLQDLDELQAVLEATVET